MDVLDGRARARKAPMDVDEAVMRIDSLTLSNGCFTLESLGGISEIFEDSEALHTP